MIDGVSAYKWGLRARVFPVYCLSTPSSRCVLLWSGIESTNARRPVPILLKWNGLDLAEFHDQTGVISLDVRLLFPVE